MDKGSSSPVPPLRHFGLESHLSQALDLLHLTGKTDLRKSEILKELRRFFQLNESNKHCEGLGDLIRIEGITKLC